MTYRVRNWTLAMGPTSGVNVPVFLVLAHNYLWLFYSFY